MSFYCHTHCQLSYSFRCCSFCLESEIYVPHKAEPEDPTRGVIRREGPTPGSGSYQKSGVNMITERFTCINLLNIFNNLMIEIL